MRAAITFDIFPKFLDVLQFAQLLLDLFLAWLLSVSSDDGVDTGVIGEKLQASLGEHLRRRRDFRTQYGDRIPFDNPGRHRELFRHLGGSESPRYGDDLEVFGFEFADDQRHQHALNENAQRDDVHPYEEAMAYSALLQNSEPKYDVASIAAKTGKSLSHIHGRLRMAD